MSLYNNSGFIRLPKLKVYDLLYSYNPMYSSSLVSFKKLPAVILLLILGLDILHHLLLLLSFQLM